MKPPKFAIAMAETALKDLATRDLLYVHHCAVHSRGDETYEKLAEYFEEYAKQRLAEVGVKS